MPFTFSHPAIILPLTYFPKKWFSLTGLVIGSIAPDFEYFIRMKVQSNYSHTWVGLLWFDLSISILLAFIFHNIVRNPFINNLPQFLQSRLSVFILFDWSKYFKKNWSIVLLSILIGSASHLLGDDFTHQKGFFVQQFSVLQTNVKIGYQQIPLFKILQHLSSLIGGIIIVFTIWKLPKHNIKIEKINYKYWLVVICITLIIIAVKLFTLEDYKSYGNLLVTSISASLISLILTSILYTKSSLKKTY